MFFIENSATSGEFAFSQPLPFLYKGWILGRIKHTQALLVRRAVADDFD
jgi:hypothetical protein